jgi:hypothetical protein
MPSTVIASLVYDPGKKILRITFVSGMVYEYLDVPEETYNAFRASGAKGVFLNREIRNKYAYKKVIS